MQPIDEKKLHRMLRWNYILLGVVALSLIAAIIATTLDPSNWALFLIPGLNMPLPIINIINVGRIRKGKKPF